MTKLRIRKATTHDAQPISALAMQTYTDAFGHSFSPADLAVHLEKNLSPKNFERMLEEDTLLVAETNGRAVGFVQFGCGNLETDSSNAQELRRLYVLADYQNKGIGTMLVNAALESPEIKNASRVFLDVWEHNPGAQRFYARYGFGVTGKREFVVESGAETSCDLIMVRTKNMTKTSDMIEAVKAGDAERVKALLAEDATLANAKDADGTSAVLIATYWGKRDIKKILLAAKPELSVHEAAAVGDEARVMDWIKAQPELLNAYSQDGFTPLQLGAFFSHADVVKFLLARGANVKAVSQNPMKLTALHSSAAANHIPITKLLLANGADVNAKQEGGFTPIHAAAQNGNAEMTKLLLDWGADPSSQTDEGKAARDFAAEGKHDAVLALLDAHKQEG